MTKPDIELTRDDELMVVQAEAQTDEGTEFIDAYYNDRLTVVDEGRIILHTDDEPAFKLAANAKGLEIA